MAEPNFAKYSLRRRAIHHWLALGPQISPLTKYIIEEIVNPVGSPFGPDGRWTLNYWAWHPDVKSFKQRLFDELPDDDWRPDDLPAPGVDGWRYVVAEEDQAIDFSRFNFTPTRFEGWVCTVLDAPEAMTVQGELLTIGPARVWLNGQVTRRYEGPFSYVQTLYVPLSLDLQKGHNTLYIHGEMLGFREARLALGFRMTEDADLSVLVPIGKADAATWQAHEDALNNIVVRQFAFPTLPATAEYTGDAPYTPVAELAFPDNMRVATDDVPTEATTLSVQPGETFELPLREEFARKFSTILGENTLVLRLRPDDGTPIEVAYELWASTKDFSTSTYGDYDSRRREALEHLAVMPFDLNGAMAAVELGHTQHIDSAAINLAYTFLEERRDTADFYAISLLAALYRYEDHILPKDLERISSAFHEFKYWLDEEGVDAMCYFTENHQILFHVAGYLVGLRWPQRMFPNSCLTGTTHINRARPLIEGWIKRRLRGNFSEWDSNAYLTLDAFAMLALVEFADDFYLRRLATTLLHKIFFLIASQSFRGVHGCTHGRCYVTGLKSARVENTSPLQRIAWGTGIFNGETRATGLLALARNYRVPDVIQRIGADQPEVLTTRARSHERYQKTLDMRSDSWDVRTLTRRTPHYMLAAAVNYEPGTMGVQEHLWQATLGPEAVVFTTYPGNSQEHGHARPNFWAGSARLPHVAMHERTVLCLYQFEEDVGLGFGHAYFPTAAFDEWHIDGQWAFARKGEGFIGLWSDGELTLTERGLHAAQELRSARGGSVWLCTVGSTTEDGNFSEFRARVIENTPERNDAPGLRWETPQGDTMSLTWEGPLLVNSVAQSEDYPHYENAYTSTPMGASTMTITHGDASLTLDFIAGETADGG